MDGPREQAVRASLEGRPAGILARLDPEPGGTERCDYVFAALHNGALVTGYVSPTNTLFIGKAEAEWGWPACWEKLRDAGLIEFETYETPSKKPGYEPLVRLRWRVTELGDKVREDDLAWFNELLDARRDDELAAGS